MDSHGDRELSRKRIKKLAARMTEQEIRESLGESAGHIAFLFEDPVGTEMRYWTAEGQMIVLQEDSVLAYAQRDFLRRRGPVFRSDQEVEEYAAKHGWPRKQAGDG
jgi:hypothetical protein